MQTPDDTTTVALRTDTTVTRGALGEPAHGAVRRARDADDHAVEDGRPILYTRGPELCALYLEVWLSGRVVYRGHPPQFVRVEEPRTGHRAWFEFGEAGGWACATYIHARAVHRRHFQYRDLPVGLAHLPLSPFGFRVSVFASQLLAAARKKKRDADGNRLDADGNRFDADGLLVLD